MPFVSPNSHIPPMLSPRTRSGGIVSSLHARLYNPQGIAPAETHAGIEVEEEDEEGKGKKRRRSRLSGTTEGISSLWKRLVRKASIPSTRKHAGMTATENIPGLHLPPPSSVLPSSIFGLCLEDAIVLSPASFPLPGLPHPVLLPQMVVQCLRLLWERGPSTEGVFRVAPRTARVSELQWDYGQISSLPHIPSPPLEAPSRSISSPISFPSTVTPHEAASLLRRYLMAFFSLLHSPGH